jgi:glucokinase
MAGGGARLAGMIRLLVDIGGTSVRLGWQAGPDDAIHDAASMPCADFSTPADALLHYCARHRLDAETLVLAVAAEISGPVVDVTNNHWVCDAAELAAALGAAQYLMINDFTAQALACQPLLTGRQNADPARFTCLRPGQAKLGAPLLVTGPGTGLGVAALVPMAGAPVVIEGEGGHVSFAPRNDAEQRVLAALTAEYGHVSAERIVSGPGLEAVYRIQTGRSLSAPDIGAGALGGDAPCRAAVDLMLQSFATVAANAALGFGAGAGIVIAGGIVARLAALLDDGGFYQRLGDHGRRRRFLEALPLYVATDPFAGLRGAAMAAESPHLAARMLHR